VVNVPLVLGGVIAIVPAFAVLYVAYQGYEGRFKDNILFVHFMFGIFGGMVLLLLEALILLPGARDFWFALGMSALGVPALEQLFKTMVLNRRSNQEQLPTIYYGGALGVGFATMAVLLKSQGDLPLWLFEQRGEMVAGTLALVLLAIGLTLLHFATGVMVGVGVAEKKLVARVVPSILVWAPFNALLVLYLRGCSTPGNPSSFVLGDCQQAYLLLAVVYAVGIGAWATLKLLPLGLDPNARRERRRGLLRKRREPAT